MSKTSKKQYRKSKKRLILAALILVVLISMFVGTVFNDWGQILRNRKNIEELNNRYVDLQEQENSLQMEVKKLQDSDYIARYAREKFLYSKDGEIILRIPNLEEDK